MNAWNTIDIYGNTTDYMLMQSEIDFSSALKAMLLANGIGQELTIMVYNDGTLEYSLNDIGVIGRLSLRSGCEIEIIRINPNSPQPYQTWNKLNKQEDAKGWVSFWVDYAKKLSGKDDGIIHDVPREDPHPRQYPQTQTPPPQNHHPLVVIGAVIGMLVLSFLFYYLANKFVLDV